MKHEIVSVESLTAAEHFNSLNVVANIRRASPGLEPLRVVDLLMKPQAYVAKEAGRLVGFVSIERPEMMHGMHWSEIHALTVFPGNETSDLGYQLVRTATNHIHGSGLHAYALVDGDPTVSGLPSFLDNGFVTQELDNRIGVVNCFSGHS